LTQLKNSANIADLDITPSQITRDNEAEFDNSDDLEPSDEDTPVASGPSHLPADMDAISEWHGLSAGFFSHTRTLIWRCPYPGLRVYPQVSQGSVGTWPVHRGTRV